jgi:periplasmic divalent cation tolerance protein
VAGPPSLMQLLTTLADRETALALARDAIHARLAACGQVIGPITSVYRWQEATHEEEEYLCLLKVPTEDLDALTSFVRDRHPYDTPEITALPSSYVDQRYLAWAQSSVTRPE